MFFKDNNPTLLNQDSLAPAYAPGTGLPHNSCVFILTDSGGNSYSFAWVPRNQQGQPLQPGTYTLQFLSGAAQGPQIVSRNLTLVADGSSGGEADFKLGPNPLLGGQALVLAYQPGPAGSRVTARAYNLAGELVASQVDASNSGRLVWQTGNPASGIYLVVLERWQGKGLLARALRGLTVVK